ncbi:MAG: glycoside hydrolase family 3 protein [Clostridia bacterium]|nr:glycoside hydrolase family 3 protein [Clostridia bacterium]
MVDLKAKPFELTDREICWVEEILASMTLEEKLSQLFVLLKAVPGADEQQIQSLMETARPGGMRWQGGDKDTVWLQNRLFQQYSRVPVFIAGNCDDGGNGVLPKEGTFVATAAEAGAAKGTETAYHIGYAAGREAAAIGVNWMFNPVADVYKNWRNTIVNTRSFGSDPDRVAECVRAYIRGIHDAAPHMACTCKHFPGDGWDELDPHISPAHNEAEPEEWLASYGRVYRTMIEEGLEAVMTGQISLPKMSRKLRPGLKDTEIMPASLAPELLQDLLRGQMGFNGLIISDASHMIGMSGVMARSEAVPRCIAAGCDMFLFANDFEEDLSYLKAGYERGIVTEERLRDALLRILGLKAKLKLYDDAVRYPDKAGLDVIGCPEHRAFTAQAADAGVTLVKDPRQLLPIDPAQRKNALLIYVQSTPNSKAYQGDGMRALITEELERAGFTVTQCPSFYDLEVENGPHPMNFVKMMQMGRREDFKKKYDVVFVFIYVKGYAQRNVERMAWSSGHSMEMPWYTEEVPTVGVSLNYTNHLVDCANIHTFINAYGPNRENVRAAVEKITGKSGFRGKADDTVFCGRWDTRL